MTRPLGTPVAFSGCAGFLHDGGGKTGVLMLPAWGFEEMTIRRGWAEFADRIAGAGYCCLRFDWPGSADSLGDTLELSSLDQWQDAVSAAARWLVEQGSLTRLVLVGHGIGGLMAPHVAGRVSAAALVMMAPQRAGRAGVRELSVWGGMLASALRIPQSAPEGGIDIAGFGLSAALVAALGKLRLDGIPPVSGVPALVVARSTRSGDEEWAEALPAAGFAVSRQEYSAYDRFVAHQSSSESPEEDFASILRWIEETVPPECGERALGAASSEDSVLKGEGFEEKPLLFGAGKTLFGVLCRPAVTPPRGVVVLVNSGYNYHVGWARKHVYFARRLATLGIASFRIDTRGIGDSDLSPGFTDPLIYGEDQIQDVVEAVDAIASLGLGPIVISGRCSGAYAALQVAVRDSRVKGVVAVNIIRFVLDPRETFEQLMRMGTSSLGDYRRRALSTGLLGDILSGRLAISHLVRRATGVLAKMMLDAIGRWGGPFTHFARLRRQVMDQTGSLASRGVKPFLVYAETDAGLDELARYFGKRAPETYAHAIVRIVPDSEHNMTAPHAREAIFEALVDAVASAERRGTVS